VREAFFPEEMGKEVVMITGDNSRTAKAIADLVGNVRVGAVITESMVKVCEPDVPPPGVALNTVTLAVPEVEISEAGMVAVSCVPDTYTVALFEPFHFTTDVETKFVPLTVSVNCGSPAVFEVGEIDVVVGTGLLIVRVFALEVCVVEMFTTVMLYVPAPARYSGIFAELVKAQAQFFKDNRESHKSDNATQKAFELTDDGVKMTIIKMKLKSIEKTMSAYNTYLRLKENEAKNLY